jgi:3'-phosphoadenosine 5'-phosphosulfate sulfotransferase (PAPS reductase)/FAD synthetase
MTHRLVEEGLGAHDYVCFADTGKERPETYEFVDRCEKFWGIRIHRVWREGYYDGLLRDKGRLPSAWRRFCTGELKVKPMKRFMRGMGHDFWTVCLGIRADEPVRAAKIRNLNATGTGEPFDYDMPLVRWGISKEDVLKFWRSMPFDLALRPDQSNCDLCFLKGRRTLLRLIAEEPHRAQWWAEWERTLGKTFRSDISYEKMLDMATSQMSLDFAPDDEFQCFCNID